VGTGELTETRSTGTGLTITMPYADEIVDSISNVTPFTIFRNNASDRYNLTISDSTWRGKNGPSLLVSSPSKPLSSGSSANFAGPNTQAPSTGNADVPSETPGGSVLDVPIGPNDLYICCNLYR
jgi:hypothetical protein